MKLSVMIHVMAETHPYLSSRNIVLIKFSQERRKIAKATFLLLFTSKTKFLNNFHFEVSIEPNCFTFPHAVHDVIHDNGMIFHDSPWLISSHCFRV